MPRHCDSAGEPISDGRNDAAPKEKEEQAPLIKKESEKFEHPAERFEEEKKLEIVEEEKEEA